MLHGIRKKDEDYKNETTTTKAAECIQQNERARLFIRSISLKYFLSPSLSLSVPLGLVKLAEIKKNVHIDRLNETIEVMLAANRNRSEIKL